MGVTESNASDIVKLGALKTALDAEQNKAVFLERVGAFANLANHFIPDSLDDKDTTDGDDFKEFAKAFVAFMEKKSK